MDEQKNMKTKGWTRKIISVLSALITGYMSFLLFLGGPSERLEGKVLSSDMLCRRNFLINALSGGPLPADIFR